MNKAIILPIIALAALFSQRLLHIEWTHEDLQTINDGILALTALLGIFMNPKKSK